MRSLKLIFVLIPFFLVSFSPKEEQLAWLGWNEGYEKAVKTDKILLVDTYTDWCGWCKRMDRDTYTNAEVIKKINQYFIPVKFNPELKDIVYKIDEQTMSGRELYAQLSQGQSTGYPTVYYIFTKKRQILLDAGYKGPKDFLKILDDAIEQSKK